MYFRLQKSKYENTSEDLSFIFSSTDYYMLLKINKTSTEWKSENKAKTCNYAIAPATTACTRMTKCRAFRPCCETNYSAIYATAQC